MPPIKVHIDDPITPKKAQDANSQSSPYPAVQPGAAAVPAPTPQAQPQPTRTTANTNYGPPAPQPGAVPIPPSQQQQAVSPPPPPKAGEKAPVTTMPAQMGVPPPGQNYSQTKGTVYSPPENTARAGGPTTINFGAVPVATSVGSHPPGYQQDLNAQEMSSAQRASLDASERTESLGQGLGMGGFGGSGSGGDGAGDTVQSAWNAVKGWATAAGNTIAETEKEVWRRINKE